MNMTAKSLSTNIFFDGISILDIHSINWDIQYDRNNQTYRMLIAVCRFVIKGLLQTTADGSTKIMDYADDQTMAKLYEKFILGYYQREHPELKAYSPQIAWQVTDGYRTLLPTMQSDIVITNKKPESLFPHGQDKANRAENISAILHTFLEAERIGESEVS